MGTAWMKTLLIPAIISLILYLIASYIVVPVWKRYHARYTHYLPLDRISNGTSTLRQRIQERLLGPLALWRRDFTRTSVPEDFGPVANGWSDNSWQDEDGEELDHVDAARREAISLDQNRGRDDNRLSIDLEQGFRDNSDDDNDDGDDTENPIEASRARSVSRSR